MKYHPILIILFISFTLLSARGFSQENNDSLIILTQSSMVPANAVPLGKAEAYGLGRIDGFIDAFSKIREKASKRNAQAILLTYFYSSYAAGKTQVAARFKFFGLSNPDSLRKVVAALKDTLLYKNYGYIYLYRPDVSEGLGGGRQVFDVIGDNVDRYNLFHGSTYAIRANPGRHTFIVDKKGQLPLEINVEPGKQYFIRCDVSKGSAGAGPAIVITFGGWSINIMQIADNYGAQLEYEVTRESEKQKEKE